MNKWTVDQYCNYVRDHTRSAGTRGVTLAHLYARWKHHVQREAQELREWFNGEDLLWVGDKDFVDFGEDDLVGDRVAAE